MTDNSSKLHKLASVDDQNLQITTKAYHLRRDWAHYRELPYSVGGAPSSRRHKYIIASSNHRRNAISGPRHLHADEYRRQPPLASQPRFHLHTLSPSSVLSQRGWIECCERRHGKIGIDWYTRVGFRKISHDAATLLPDILTHTPSNATLKL